MEKNSTETLYTQENSQYLESNPTWHVEDSPWKARQILKILDRNGLYPKTVAELGCGAGEILNQLYAAMPMSVMFSGFDISPDGIRLANEKTKERLNFYLSGLPEDACRFDLLLLIDVLEHVPDYLGFLSQCKGKASYTIFHIPLDISAQAVLRDKLMKKRKSVGHLHYFTKDTALATLRDTGYEVVDYFYTTSAFELPRKTLKSQLAFLPRKIMYKINQDLAVKLLGGCSLIVLTK